jgi:predicted nucleic acid-binding protein
MIYCFDTSAINALHDDEEAEVVLSRLLKPPHRIHVTCVNIAEVVSTSGESRRHALLLLLKQMSNGTNPLQMPNKLIRRATKAFAKGKLSLTVTITDEDSTFWWLMDDPASANGIRQVEALRWKESLERPFIDAHREARPAFQSLFNDPTTPPPRSVAQLLRSFRQQDGAIYEFLKRFYKKETGRYLSRDTMWRMFDVLPMWPLYLAGWGHEMFARAIRTSNYGIKGKPGTLDLWCAIYLPICDRFVTNDKGQYRALRLLNVLNKRFFETPTKTHVLGYGRFKEELFTGV